MAAVDITLWWAMQCPSYPSVVYLGVAGGWRLLLVSFQCPTPISGVMSAKFDGVHLEDGAEEAEQIAVPRIPCRHTQHSLPCCLRFVLVKIPDHHRHLRCGRTVTRSHEVSLPQFTVWPKVDFTSLVGQTVPVLLQILVVFWSALVWEYQP